MSFIRATESNSIPEGWRAIEFDSFTTLQRGKDLTRATFKDGIVPVAGSNGVIGYHDKPNTKAPGVTVGRSGSVGKVTYYEKDFWAHNTSLFVRDFHDNHPRFAYYYLSFLDLGHYKSGASVPTLDRNQFRTLQIAVPPLPEQRKIAYILSTIQKAIEQQDAIIQTTIELKKALMHKLFTEGLRGEPQKETEIGLIPESWKPTTLGKCATVKSGGTPSRKRSEYWEGGTVPWVKTGEINYRVITETEEYITLKGVKNSAAKVFPKGTLLVAMYGQGITRGRVGILGIDATTNQACVAVIPYDETFLSSAYLYHYLEYKYEDLRNLGHGANQKNLSATIIKAFEIPVPTSCEEQSEISKIFDNLNKKITQVTNRKQLYEDLFKSLLHQLMTAQIRVHDINFDHMPKLVN